MASPAAVYPEIHLVQFNLASKGGVTPSSSSKYVLRPIFLLYSGKKSRIKSSKKDELKARHFFEGLYFANKTELFYIVKKVINFIVQL